MTQGAYPEQTRLIRQACAARGWRFEDLDDGGGYLFAVSDGRHEIVGGAGAVCAYPINLAAPLQIARDKAHANQAMARAGLPVIDSRLFFTNDRRIRLRTPGREVADALAWVRAAPGAVFCKPNTGSGGDFAEVVEGPDAFLDYVARIAPHHEAALIQPVIQGTEHRVFCLDGEARFSTRKSDLTLTGDGVSALSDLLAAANARLSGTGVSATPATALVDPGRVPAPGERIMVRGRRNIAAGGEADLSTEAPPALADLAVRACEALGLRVGGLDVFDRSAAGDLSDLVIIEINGNPALSSLVAARREDLAVEIFGEVFAARFFELGAGWR